MHKIRLILRSNLNLKHIVYAVFHNDNRCQWIPLPKINTNKIRDALKCLNGVMQMTL